MGGVLVTLFTHESCNRLHRVSPTAFLCKLSLGGMHSCVVNASWYVHVATITVGSVMYYCVSSDCLASAKYPLPYVVKNQCTQASVIN